MSIQFLCPACSQPIEIDDEWSARPVACPYCRKTITAPESSTFDPASAAPQAAPVVSPSPSPEGLAPPYPTHPAGTNSLAPLAFGLAAASCVLNLYFRVATMPRILEQAGAGASPQEVQQAMMDLAGSGVMPGWLMAGFLAILGSAGLWVAGLVCGIIAVTRPARRRLAVASLGLCGLTMIMCCIGG